MKTYNPRIGEVRVTDLVDVSVIRSLSESGFVDKHFAGTESSEFQRLILPTLDTITGKITASIL